jgi:NitT/TauT family transport system permease protein
VKSTATQLAAPESNRSFGLVDLVVFAALLGLLWSILQFGRGMVAHFDQSQILEISTDVRMIPYYAGRTLLRMWIAFVCSLLFTFGVGYAAAKNNLARAIILPALDVLQSVPVLSFLTITVTGFMALFPGSLLGVECASIFAIFTGQVWNMTFGFYHSMVTIPRDLQEAATNFRLTAVQRFGTLEVPASMHSLIWNAMMSFGGGWFFVTQSEAITVLNHNIKLPGLGSYMAAAVERGDNFAAAWAIIAMVFVIVCTDQLVWRPLLVWADRFKIELTESAHPPMSWFYNLLRRAYLFVWLEENLVRPAADFWSNFRLRSRQKSPRGDGHPQLGLWLWQALGLLAAMWLIYQIILGITAGFSSVYQHVSFQDFLHIVGLGLLTFLRVFTVTILATLIWTPVGVWIGLKPRAAQIAQPLAQIFASFPTNMTFPIIVGLFVRWKIPMDWGSILLIAMGTQWYILFNVVAGAMAIPNDLKEAAKTYGLRDWPLWKTLIIPAIFPFWITGACTAAGGAWNASIVAEIATWGNLKLQAHGLGAFIAQTSQSGDTPRLICATALMAFFVVTINKLLWRPLYSFAERRFHLD